MEEINKKSMLNERKEALKIRREKVQLVHQMMFFLSLVMVVAIPIFIWKSRYSGIASILAIYMIIPISFYSIARNRFRELEQDLKEVEIEIDLQQYQVSIAETRAEKILRINDSQLQRYYNVNLSQNMWVFGLGIFCILLGILVIVGTLYAVLAFAETLETKIIIGILGSISSLLTSYIAAIYLKMHAEASLHLGSFHGRLVDTHQTLLANLVTSRIEDPKLKEETLSKLALSMRNRG